jgi:drug/metabolite transporter (DMT)-like permease
MIGVAGGLVAAVLWGLSSIAAARSTRMIGAESALAWVFLVGLVIALPVALALGFPNVDRNGSGWAAPTVVITVASLYALYAALRRGPVSLVAPITASQGALAAVLAVALGESLQGAAAVGLIVIFVGMFAVMRRPRAGEGNASHPSTAIAFALASAVLSAFALYGSARAGSAIGAAWLLVFLRTGGLLSLGGPLLLSGRLRRPGPATPLIVFSGVADYLAFGSYVIAATHGGVAVPAVISSQYAAVAALLAVILLGERLTRPQLAGVVAILAGVAVVTAVQG